MKKITVIMISYILIVISCRIPSEPLGELKIVKRLDTINTGGDCLDLDVSDSLLIAAANHNGFLLYNIYDSNGELNPYEIFHGTDMAPNLGDDRIEKVLLSENHDFMVLFDKYDKIYFADKKGNPLPTVFIPWW